MKSQTADQLGSQPLTQAVLNRITATLPAQQASKGAGYVFSSVDAAATDLLLRSAEMIQTDKAGERDERYERGGDIVKVDGGYTYNNIQNDRDTKSIEISSSIYTVGWAHVHTPSYKLELDRSNKKLSVGRRADTGAIEQIYD